jgi:hypothetical protein
VTDVRTDAARPMSDALAAFVQEFTGRPCGCSDPTNHASWVGPLLDALALNWPLTEAVRHAIRHALALLAAREAQLAEARDEIGAVYAAGQGVVYDVTKRAEAAESRLTQAEATLARVREWRRINGRILDEHLIERTFLAALDAPEEPQP